MKHLRKILFPFSFIYGVIVLLRNKFFDFGLFSSKTYAFPVICVGNLSTGGTGKSPMVEYLTHLLNADFQVAILSRGYKRKSKGFFLLKGDETAAQVGDEPLQFKTKFPKTLVAVDSDRQHGISKLMDLIPPPSVILLDDAFQHRKVKAGLSILLTSYGDLYRDDWVLPTGNLREFQGGAKRAHIVVVTKCPDNMSKEEEVSIEKRLQLHRRQTLFFVKIGYNSMVTNGIHSIPLAEFDDFILVTGIANPRPLVNFLKKKKRFIHKKFSDHHHFTPSELETLQSEKLILTTEKDFVRLKNELPQEKLFYLPIRMELLKNAAEFSAIVQDFCRVI